MKKLSRRNFISAAPFVGSAVLGLTGIASGQKGKLRVPDMLPADGVDNLARLSYTSFALQANSEFIFYSDGNEVPLKLVGMTNSTPARLKYSRVKGQESFILTFSGHPRFPLKQGTYTVSHPALGAFNLFITEGGKTSQNLFFVAVINRVIS